MGKNGKFGLLIRAGGNKVFFANGVLKVLNQEKIRADHVFGFSSSSIILFAYLNNLNDEALKIFSNKLKENPKNFYLFNEEHFPHDNIYKTSIIELLQICNRENIGGYSIFSLLTSPRYARLKGLLSTLILSVRGLMNWNVHKYFNRLISAKTLEISHSHQLKKDELVNLIMGSSTIYPFIKLRKHSGNLMLDGSLVEIDHSQIFSNFDKGIVIHTKKGRTSVVGNVLHIFPDIDVSNNILNYTDPQRIKELHLRGVEQATIQLPIIKKFLNIDDSIE